MGALGASRTPEASAAIANGSIRRRLPSNRLGNPPTGMKARELLFVEPGVVEIRDVDVPDPGAGEVLVRTAFSGISGGTEMLAYRGDLDPDMRRDETLGALRGTFRYPFAYGYAAAGVVERPRGPLA